MFCAQNLYCVTLDQRTGITYLEQHDLEEGGTGIAYHDSTILVDPFQSQVTLANELIPLDEKKIRHAFNHLMHEPFVAAWRVNSEKGMLFSCSDSVMSDTLSSSNRAGLSPSLVLDGNIVWQGLMDFFHINEHYPIFVIGRGHTFAICFFIQGLLHEVDHLTWDSEIGDLASFVLTEVIPCLQSHGVLDEDRKLYVVHWGEQMVTDFISLLKDKLRIKDATVLSVDSYGDLLLGCLEPVVLQDLTRDTLAYQQRSELPIVSWHFLGVGLLLLSAFHGLYIGYTLYDDNTKLTQLSSQMQQYDSIRSDYVGVLSKSALSMRSGFTKFLHTLACQVPRDVWLTGMVLQMDKQKLYVQGHTRTKINLHEYGDDLLRNLDFSPQNLSVYYVDSSVFLDIMGAKKRSLRDELTHVLDIFNLPNVPYEPGKRLDSLSFQITNLQEGEKLSF